MFETHNNNSIWSDNLYDVHYTNVQNNGSKSNNNTSDNANIYTINLKQR